MLREAASALQQRHLRRREILLHAEQHDDVSLLDAGLVVRGERAHVAPAHGGYLDAPVREADLSQRPADRGGAARDPDRVQARLILLAVGLVGDAAKKSPEQAVALLA